MALQYLQGSYQETEGSYQETESGFSLRCITGEQKTMIELKGGKLFFYIRINTHRNGLPRVCLMTLFLEVFKT